MAGSQNRPNNAGHLKTERYVRLHLMPAVWIDLTHLKVIHIDFDWLIKK